MNAVYKSCVKLSQAIRQPLNRIAGVLLLAILLVVMPGGNAYGQNRPKRADVQKTLMIDKLFTQIESGISKGDISLLADFFSNQTYLSLSSGQNGYYSANQAYYIIQEYFKIHQPVLFRYTAKNIQRLPYATGVFQYESAGRKRSAQVFISLKRQGNNWQISQFTIR